MIARSLWGLPEMKAKLLALSAAAAICLQLVAAAEKVRAAD